MQAQAAQTTRSFPLAVLAAAAIFWVTVGIGAVSFATVTFHHGALTGLNALLSWAFSAAVYGIFYVFLLKGSAVAAVLFALLGVWNFFDAINGSPSLLISVADIIFGVLGVVGIAGVWNGFKSKAPT